MTTLPVGYTYNDSSLAASPVAMPILSELLVDIMWNEDDSRALRRAGEILRPQTSEILDTWYHFIGSTPHLVATFRGRGGEPDQDYLDKVRGRFERWIVDLCTRDFDAQWLAYQEEIGQRHTPAKKNQTDGVDSPATHVPMSHLIALIVPVTVTVRKFLERGAAEDDNVDAMQQAWFKAVTLSVALWTRPYAPDLW